MRRALLLAPLLIAGGAAAAAELQVLSAGAVEPGLAAAVAGWGAATGGAASITYATAPRLAARMAAGERPDLLVVPAALATELLGAGRIAAPLVPLGRVGVGVVVRADAPAPAITDAASLRRAVEAADAVVFNRASTGQHMAALFDRLGLTPVVAPKARRYATGAEVLDHLLRGQGDELGFAATTEIGLVPALRPLGPLPPALQNETAYVAALPTGHDAAQDLLRWLAGAQARDALTRGGITPP